LSIPSSGRASPSLRWGWTKNKQKHKLKHVPGLTHGLDQKSEAGHRKRFESWSGWVRTEAEALTSGLLEPMRKAAEMVERHLEGVLAHWQQGLTTAFLEGLNSLFSATKRKARGYRSVKYQTAMLYFVAGKLEIP
jgi:transposase